MTENTQVYSTGGHLTVRRDLHDFNTQLCEVWVLDHLIWAEENLGEYDIVKCYVASINDIPQNGIPHSDHRVNGLCSWDEVPSDVREQFVKQAENLKTVIEQFSDETADANQ